MEEDNYIKEKRQKRYHDIISLKKKRAYLESIKLYPNYSYIYSSNLPYLKEIKKEKKIDKNRINNLTERTNNSKINIKNNLSNLPIPSFHGIDRININNKFISLQTSKTNKILDISKEKSNINTNRKNILSERNQIHLFNIKTKKKKRIYLLNNFNKNKNKYLNISNINSSKKDKKIIRNVVLILTMI